jgi:hypothetical protein
MGKIQLVREDQTKHTRLQRAYNTISKVAIKYGTPYININGKSVCRYEDRHVKEFWDYDEISPPIFYFQKNTNIKDIRKIIQERISLTHRIWNPDFIQGLCLNGEVTDTNDKKYISLEWESNKHIGKILSKCPFGGDLVKGKWKTVPILDVRYSDKSFSYMAGLFSAGNVVTKNYKQYALYYGDAKDKIVDLKIPLEYESANMVMISPIWPALFAPKMPKGTYRNKWKNLKNPSNGSFYSTLLWKSYMNNDFPTGALPFMKSRRSIYYDYKCEEGAMQKLESLRIDTGLVELNLIFRDIVQSWGGNI